MDEIMISVKPKFVKSMIAGVKTVEIRKNRFPVNAGDIIWIYSTIPSAAIEIVVRVDSIEIDKPEAIWDKYKKSICLTKNEYISYLGETKDVSAIKICNIKLVNPIQTLSHIRTLFPRYHPPQHLKRLKNDSKLETYLSNLYLSPL